MQRYTARFCAFSIQFTKRNWSHIFRSYIFHPCILCPAFLVLYFQSCIFRFCIFLPWKFGPSFSSRVGQTVIHLALTGPSFSGPAFSVDPMNIKNIETRQFFHHSYHSKQGSLNGVSWSGTIDAARCNVPVCDETHQD